MAQANRFLTKTILFALIGASALTGAALHAESMSKPNGGGMMAPAGILQGTFLKAEAPVSGGFVIKTEGGHRVLVLSSDFKTNSMAPDLKVIFSPSATPWPAPKPPGSP
jgi:hypothetical protein